MRSVIEPTKDQSVIESASRAKRASGLLARLSSEAKNRALLSIAKRVGEQAETILAANSRDLDRARPLVEAGQMAESVYRRLKLDPVKIADIVRGIEQVAALDDPIGTVTLATELDEGLKLYRVNCPIGVVGVVFESRPDALAQITSLCLKSGNAVLLKGGREAEHSNRALFNAIHSAALDAGVPSDALVLLETREEVAALLRADEFVDLIIPRGSNELVRYVQQNTNISVLGHAEGICHVYVDNRADLEKALSITIDAKTEYPAVCNAVETLLVHCDVARDFLAQVIPALQQKGVEVRLDEDSIRKFYPAQVGRATEEDWNTEYCDLVLSVKVVNKIDEAIEHINRYGSRHTDAIITEDSAAFDRFLAEVDSAGIFLNASTRFADGYRYGFGAEVGISTGKLHPRGPVGLEGLVTYKYKLIGRGHTVAPYSGPNRKRFTHRAIED